MYTLILGFISFLVPIEDRLGLEVPTQYYRSVEYDLREYPELLPLAKQIMADGKMTIFEKAQWEKALQKAAAKRLKKFIENFDPNNIQAPAPA